MGTLLKFFGIVFVLFILIVALVLGYFFVGLNKPKDLGMEFSAIKYEEALEKAKVELKTAAPDAIESISYKGSHEVKASFSDGELTAHAHNKDWEHYPVENVQVRINDDGTCEVSGIAKLERLDGFFDAMNISVGDYKSALEEANIPITDVAFYAKGNGSAKNNTLDLNLTSFKVGNFPVPQNIINENQGLVEEFGYSIMRNIPGFSVNEARFENGSIYFDGTLPDAEFAKGL